MGSVIEPVNITGKKSNYKAYTLIALAISISVQLLFIFNIGNAMMGNVPTFSDVVETTVFLVIWLVYGVVMGYKREEGFIKFVSIYWALTGLMSITSALMAPIGKWAIIVIPVEMLNFAPTYGLDYFTHVNVFQTLYGIIHVIPSWLSGLIGFLLGYLLKKIKFGMIIPPPKPFEK